MIDTNLTSAFRLTKNAGKHMLAQGSGKVINIAFVPTFKGGVFVPSYAAAKGAASGTDEGIGVMSGQQRV